MIQILIGVDASHLNISNSNIIIFYDNLYDCY